MRFFWALLILLVTTLVTRVGRADEFSATCIVPRGGSNGTITAVYLSGQYPERFHNPNVFTNWETRNRAKLQKIADETGATIAVPQGDVRTIRKVRDFTWEKVGPEEFQARALSACPGNKFRHPALIAFSSGAKRAALILQGMSTKDKKGRVTVPSNCGSLGVYSRIVIMGDQGVHGNYNNGCGGRVHQIGDHHFPPLGINLKDEIEGALDQSADSDPVAPPVDKQSDRAI